MSAKTLRLPDPPEGLAWHMVAGDLPGDWDYVEDQDGIKYILAPQYQAGGAVVDLSEELIGRA